MLKEQWYWIKCWTLWHTIILIDSFRLHVRTVYVSCSFYLNAIHFYFIFLLLLSFSFIFITNMWHTNMWHRIHRNFIIRIFRNIGEVGKYLLLDNSTKGSHWWQGWPSGESTCLPPMWPRFDFCTRHHVWVEFVGSLLCYERFSPLTKNQHLIWFDLWLFL